MARCADRVRDADHHREAGRPPGRPPLRRPDDGDRDERERRRVRADDGERGAGQRRTSSTAGSTQRPSGSDQPVGPGPDREPAGRSPRARRRAARPAGSARCDAPADGDERDRHCALAAGSRPAPGPARLITRSLSHADRAPVPAGTAAAGSGARCRRLACSTTSVSITMLRPNVTSTVAPAEASRPSAPAPNAKPDPQRDHREPDAQRDQRVALPQVAVLGDRA